jgi:hypothetical protein
MWTTFWIWEISISTMMVGALRGKAVGQHLDQAMAAASVAETVAQDGQT